MKCRNDEGRRDRLSGGTLSTDINPKAALEMDGPAFNAARDLMTKMKSESTVTIQISAPDLNSVQLVNGALKLMGNVISHLSRNNLTILERIFAGSSTKEIASELSITPRAVNKAIARHALDDVVELTHILTRELTKGLDLGPVEEESR